MSDTSYLFGGNTPSSIATPATDTSSTLPAWLQEYTRSLAGQATEVAGGEYQPFQAPSSPATYGQDIGRIAGFDPMQSQAFSNVQANQGVYQPYLNTASKTIPQAIGDYMSPYQDDVVDRLAVLGQRNLTENLLPQVNSTFTGAGQFGSTRNADFNNRALRDANESILGQQAQALNQGYQQAGQTALQDLQRQAALGGLAQNYGYVDTGMLATAGQQKQGLAQQNMDLGFKDWANQNDWQKQNLSWLSDIIRGQQVQPSTFQSANNLPALQNQMSPLAAATQGLLGAGQRAAQPNRG